ncbi:MAG: hypothetical protein KGN02_10465 [bacterium]|nr:hypothetical protein [bacterium]
MTNTPPAIRVTVNDRALQSIAIMERGHVLVPMRAIFEALHAPLPQGHLRDSRIIAGRTFIPIRSAAGMLGASVYYDGRAHLVSVYRSTRATPLPSPSPVPVSGLNPAPDSRIASAYPTISAQLQLDPDAFIRTLRLYLDGVDYTREASYDGVYVTFIPRRGLQPGTHDVRLDGTSSDGAPFHVAWQFETTLRPPRDDGDENGPNLPGYYGFSPLQLTVFADSILGGRSLDVQLVGPPNGRAFAFICTSPWQYELYSAPQSPFYNGTLPTQVTNATIACPITAMFVSPNGAVTYAPYPQFVTILPQPTAPPAPVPTPTRLYPQPVATRSPEPHPTTAPTAAPTARPTSHPTPHPTWHPMPRPSVHPLPRPTLRPIPATPVPVETARPTPHATATPARKVTIPRDRRPRPTPPPLP